MRRSSFCLAAWTNSIAEAPKPSVSPALTHKDRLVLAGAELPSAQGSRRAIKSIINVKKKMSYGDYVWNEEAAFEGPIWVQVDLAKQMLSVFRGGHEIGTAVILYGADEKPTPTGMFKVIAKRKDHRSSLYDAPMPYTLRLTDDGVAIHGSDVRWGAATHGCVGVPLAFAERLFAAMKVGDEVAVISSRSARKTPGEASLTRTRTEFPERQPPS